MYTGWLLCPAMEPTESDSGPRRLLLYGLPALAVLALLVIILAVLDIGPLADDSLTESEFLAQGDQICLEAREEFAQRQQELPQTAKEAADLAESLLGISRQELEAIEELGAPDQLEGALDEYLAAREAGIALLREGMEAARDDDVRGYTQAQIELSEGQAERAELAEAVGFSECSRPLSAESAEDSPDPPKFDPSEE